MLLSRLKNFGVVFELVKVDACWYDDQWIWNQSFTIGRFTSRGKDDKLAFLRALKKQGISCKRGYCKVEDRWDVFELQERKSSRPLYAAIMVSEVGS